MGQKIHPTGFRLALNRNWASRWYSANKNFPSMLLEDIKVRDHLRTKLAHAAVSRVVIERPAKNARITIYSARPGVVIGKKGEDIVSLKVVRICVDKGPVLKRFAARAKGRGARIIKPTCHVFVTVGDGRN